MSSSDRLLSVCCRPSVCRLPVTFVRPNQPVEIFGNLSMQFGTMAKFYRDRPRRTPPSGALNTRGVAEYSDFGHIEDYISETVQDKR